MENEIISRKGEITIAKKGTYDWEKIRGEYIGGGISYRALAEKYSIPFGTLKKRADVENWSEQRKKAVQKSVTKAVQRTADAAAANAVKLEKARALLIDKIIAAIEQMPDKSGTHIRQSHSDRDTGRQISIDYDLMQLVTALEKLSNGAAADDERQKKFAEENNTTLMTYADLFSRPAPQRTIEQLEGGDDV